MNVVCYWRLEVPYRKLSEATGCWIRAYGQTDRHIYWTTCSSGARRIQIMRDWW